MDIRHFLDSFSKISCMISTCILHRTHGFFYTTIIVEPSKYLIFLYERIKKLGGTFEQKALSSLSDAAMFFVRNRDTLTTAHRPDFIVNCSGLGARILAKDSAVHPIRGQILRVSPKQASDSRSVSSNIIWFQFGTERDVLRQIFLAGPHRKEQSVLYPSKG